MSIKEWIKSIKNGSIQGRDYCTYWAKNIVFRFQRETKKKPQSHCFLFLDLAHVGRKLYQELKESLD